MILISMKKLSTTVNGLLRTETAARRAPYHGMRGLTTMSRVFMLVNETGI